MLRRALPTFLLMSCSNAEPSGARTDAAPIDATRDAASVDAGPCGVTIRQVPLTSGVHVADGTPLDASSNPPTGGDHYGSWVRWGSHDLPLAPGNWIHNLEHGGIVIGYRCATRAACTPVAARLEALAASLPQDPACSSEMPPVRARVVIAAMPDLPSGVEVAAMAWGWLFTARCVDETAVREFHAAHVGKAPEDTCANGTIATSADAGGD